MLGRNCHRGHVTTSRKGQGLRRIRSGMPIPTTAPTRTKEGWGHRDRVAGTSVAQPNAVLTLCRADCPPSSSQWAVLELHTQVRTRTE